MKQPEKIPGGENTDVTSEYVEKETNLDDEVERTENWLRWTFVSPACHLVYGIVVSPKKL